MVASQTLLGTTIGRYAIEAVAGRGGMGVVYRARDPQLHRVVALKLIAPELARDASFRARFVRESRLAASLDHPNVIPVFDAGEDDGRLYIAMRFIAGTDLQKMIRAEGALDPALAVDLISQAAAALDAAHARGLVHRDVKPANLLVDGGHVYLTDFGVAKPEDGSTSLTSSGGWLGTPDYMSPEQAEGHTLDARSDVYSLGCVLFSALTGQAPFADVARPRKVLAHLDEPPPSLRSLRPVLPAALEPVLSRALAKDPAARFGSAGELAAAARAALAGAPAPGPARAPRTQRTAKIVRPSAVRARLPVRALVTVAVVAIVGLGAALALGAFSGGAGSHPARGPVSRLPASLPQPSGPAGTVRCSDMACRQGATRVSPPIEDGSCAGGGTWSRIDKGGPPIYACFRATPPVSAVTVPDLTGARLDRAEDYLDSLGVDHRRSGGGLLGILDASNWRVCATAPAAGSAAAGGVRLFAERSC